MKLNKLQIDFYDKNGYLIIKNLFSFSEISILKNAISQFENLKDLPNIICEEEGDIRSIFAPHLYDNSFDLLYKQERIVNPVKQILNKEVYLYQYKLNNKKALTGKFWEWHQDFPYWHLDDGIRLPKMVSVMILFQETNSYQGPLIFIPGSHKRGVVDFEYKKHLKNKNHDLIHSLNSDLKYTIDKNFLKEAFENCEIIEGNGASGTCIFFHPNLFHASNSNISPFDRQTAILTYNAIDNLPQNNENNRPEYLCSRSFDAIKGTNKDLIGEYNE